MRKFNIRKKNGHQMRINSEPGETTIDGSPLHHTNRYSRGDTLQSFHDSLLKKSEILSRINHQSYALKRRKLADIENAQHKYESVKKISEDLKSLKGQIERNNNYQQQRREEKLDRFMENLKDHVRKSNQKPFQLPPVQPFYYPFPPNYSMVPSQFLYREQNRRKFKTTTRDEDDTFYDSRRKPKPKINKAQRTRKNIKRWRKVANAVYFTFLLKKFCNTMRNHRQLVFNTVKTSLKANLNIIKEDLFKLLKGFFGIIVNKRDVNLQVEEDDDQSIKKQKITTIRKLITMVLQAAAKWTTFAKDNKKFTQIIYLLCRHGNYSCTEPILTEEELELTCISSKFKFVSADKNLQAAAYINLLFIKLIIFNILLAPSKYSSQLAGATIEDNLEVISSILYELVIDVQDDFMGKVSLSYKIGNYKGISWVQKAQPLSYKGSSLQKGELISGLKGEEWVKKNYKIESWKKEKSMINSTLSLFHGMMLNYHSKLMKKVLKNSQQPNSSFS